MWGGGGCGGGGGGGWQHNSRKTILRYVLFTSNLFCLSYLSCVRFCCLSLSKCVRANNLCVVSLSVVLVFCHGALVWVVRSGNFAWWYCHSRSFCLLPVDFLFEYMPFERSPDDDYICQCCVGCLWINYLYVSASPSCLLRKLTCGIRPHILRKIINISSENRKENLI